MILYHKYESFEIYTMNNVNWLPLFHKRCRGTLDSNSQRKPIQKYNTFENLINSSKILKRRSLIQKTIGKILAFVETFIERV